ncbi:MAG: cell wall-associated NlpC family hydrolase [Janthinobacterium sp.]|jgi:cell wall-associated NlpC family hydrolase
MASKIILLCCQILLLPICLAAPLPEQPPAGPGLDRFVEVLARARAQMPASADDGESDGVVTQDPMSVRAAGNEIALRALDLIGISYRYGGKTPETGLDCSGMVAYIFQKVAGLSMAGSAANLARHGHSVTRLALRPGDLVFFNTMHRRFSHVGIYIGGQRFVHAPSTNGMVRIDRLDSSYYAQRYETARSYLD